MHSASREEADAVSWPIPRIAIQDAARQEGPCEEVDQDEYRAEGNESLLGDSDFDGCRGHASSKCGGKHIAQVFRAVHEVLPLPPRAVHGLFGDPERDGRWCWFLVKQGCLEERQDNDKRRAPEQYDGCPEDTT